MTAQCKNMQRDWAVKAYNILTWNMYNLPSKFAHLFQPVFVAKSSLV